LTGLLNRAEFRRQVDEALAAVGSPEQVVVLYLDLDDFKAVNDSAGHAVGDELLTTMAARLLSAVRGSDTVARLGGDEFAVLLRDVTRDVEAEIVATRIIGALGGNCQLGERVLRVRASVGLARSEADKGVDMLLRHADMAMYAAKAAGGDRLEWFAPVMHAAALDRAQLEADLLPALERGEFWVAYQPVVSLEDGRVQGAEALVRWTHPERGTISPAQFIPLAEATGHILALGRWVLEEACRAAMTLPGPFTMSVNLSARQLEDVGLADEVRAILARTGLDAGRLMLELTETALMADTERALVQLQALKAMGIRLAVDDFGTGYSSLRYLQQFPVDVLKIDRSFVDRVDRSESDAALVRTIIALGEQLGLRLVAEGIEREAQWRRVQALGCTAGQGYHFARPLPLPELQQWVQRSTAATGSDSGTGRAQPESHGRAAA
jgi:diguanylate cyclase (GGDEF)-like protein